MRKVKGLGKGLKKDKKKPIRGIEKEKINCRRCGHGGQN